MKFLLLFSTKMQSPLILYLLSTYESTCLYEISAPNLSFLLPAYVKDAHVACLCYLIFNLVLV